MGMYTKEDADFMRLAFTEAHKSLYLSNPNPRVGCVIVKAGQVIGTGFTQQVGLAHAEIEALADARKNSDTEATQLVSELDRGQTKLMAAGCASDEQLSEVPYEDRSVWSGSGGRTLAR